MSENCLCQLYGLSRHAGFLPVCAEKAPLVGGDKSARNEISVLIAGMSRAVRGEHHITVDIFKIGNFNMLTCTPF